MNLHIDMNKLRETTKLFIATPMYGGNCTGVFADACQKLARLLGQFGVPHHFHFIYNESLITRARNYCVDEFMRSDCTHMIFIDADIEFNPDQVLSLLWLQTEDSPYDVICAPYPKKCISWEKIKLAVDKGLADENPAALEQYVGDFVFNFPPGKVQFNLFAPAEVMESGTGFMMIRRRTFETWKEAYPEYSYLPDHVRSNSFDGTREIMQYFQAAIDPDSKRYLSEDYWFCQLARKAGLKVWICPWINLRHFGTMNFTGNFVAMAQNGVTLTANKAEVDKMRQQPATPPPLTTPPPEANVPVDQVSTAPPASPILEPKK
jgi:hypothetical protein